VCSRVLQWVAVVVLHCFEVLLSVCCSVLLSYRCVAVGCSVLQWVAVCCSGLQYDAVGCSMLQRLPCAAIVSFRCSALQ